MRSIRSLVKSLRTDFPELTIVESDEFRWSAAQNTVYIDPSATCSPEYTLHEISHAVLRHKGYDRDIDLLKLERDAWHYARTTLAPHYGISIDGDTVQDNIDTYRHWLHSRSKCPECETTGIQKKDRVYACLACGHLWRVNDAKLCGLRRYSLQSK